MKLLRDYIWSLTFVALALMVYTAVVLHNRKTSDSMTRAAASVVPQNGVSAAASTP